MAALLEQGIEKERLFGRLDRLGPGMGLRNRRVDIRILGRLGARLRVRRRLERASASAAAEAAGGDSDQRKGDKTHPGGAIHEWAPSIVRHYTRMRRRGERSAGSMRATERWRPLESRRNFAPPMVVSPVGAYVGEVGEASPGSFT